MNKTDAPPERRILWLIPLSVIALTASMLTALSGRAAAPAPEAPTAQTEHTLLTKTPSAPAETPDGRSFAVTESPDAGAVPAETPSLSADMRVSPTAPPPAVSPTDKDKSDSPSAPTTAPEPSAEQTSDTPETSGTPSSAPDGGETVGGAPASETSGERDVLSDAEILLTVRDAESGEVYETTMEEHLKYALAAEMSASAPFEALKAQAVAIRSYILSKADAHRAAYGAMTCTDVNCCMSCRPPDAYAGMREEERAVYERARRETDGLVMYYDGKIVTAHFHSCSYYRTADAGEVYGREVPYLQSVPTWVYKEVFHTYEYSAAELLSRLLPYVDGALADGLSAPFGHCAETRDGRVASMTFFGVTVPGEVFRRALGFPSTVFEVSYDPADGTYTFYVYGSGHGVGMSQSGAKVMAAEGESYDAILRHYYTGVEIAPLLAAPPFSPANG